MKILIYSDLHLEFADFEPPDVRPDLVILAGDISTRARGVIWACYAFECPVLYVAGNHEYYQGHMDATFKQMQDAASPHVHVLNNACYVLGGVTPTSKALTPEQQKIQELEARINRLEREKSILKKATALLMAEEHERSR
ncbi:Calcineurin-like phosphoesterase [compost metagenome]